jgi:pyroglutamyl-peptidase
VRVLLTAFEPYEQWKENSSWLTLVELLKDRPQELELVTRRYPVDLATMREKLYKDLQLGFDVIIHLGQSPGSPQIKLESIALNVAGRVENSGEELSIIEEHGPAAYRSSLPLGRWAALLREHSIPTVVSYHAGTYLCNATMYSSIHLGQGMPKPPLVGFIHLPLSMQQAASNLQPLASMDVRTMASAIRLLLVDLAENYRASKGSRAKRQELA